MRFTTRALWTMAALLSSLACAGGIGGGADGAGGSAGASGGDGDGGDDQPSGDGAWLPARVRRLSNAEYDRTVAVLLGTTSTPGRDFTPDIRQSDFTINADQRVDPVFAARVQTAAAALAQESLTQVLGTVGCAATAASNDTACARAFISSFVPRAFRRPLGDEERSDLLTVFQTGANGGTFGDGAELVLRAVLQSSSFLYVTELGDSAPRNGLITLAPFETASALAYLLTGGPPDQALLDDAAAGNLSTAGTRNLHARRLIDSPGARAQIRRLIEEWLHLDLLESTGKDKQIYPRFEELRPSMAAETDAFIDEVVFQDDGTIGTLLAADYTVVDELLGGFYGLPGGSGLGKRSPLSGGPRRGLLTQASFLSVHGHDHESAPIKRGAVVLKKLLCASLPTPSELNITVVPPKPDPNLTTRERFALHSQDAACASCHALIDPIGFAFENFDGMGAHRTTENGRPVVTAAEVEGSLAGPVKDATELTARLADSEQLKTCFARQLFRFAAAQSGEPFEEKFFKEVWNLLSASSNTNVKDVLVAWAASSAFVTRQVGP